MMKFMWGQKQSAMLAEAMLLNFAEKNHLFTITEKMDDVLREHKNGFSFIYFTERVIEDGYCNGKHFLDAERAKKILDKIQEVRTKFLLFVEAPKKDLLSSFHKYREHLLFIQKLFRASDPSSTKLVEETIRHVLSDDEFIIATTPAEIDLIQQEMIDFCTLKYGEDSFMKHIKKYPGNFCNTWSYNEMKSHLHKRMKEMDVSELKEEITTLVAGKKELAQKQQEIFRKHPKIEFSCKLLQTLALTRLELKHCWAGAETLCLDFLKSIALKTELDFETFMMSYNLTDTIQLLTEGKRLTPEEVKERLSYSVIHYTKDRLVYLFGREAQDYFSALHQKKKKKKNEDLKGLVASKGMVRGKVKIINVEDLKQLEKDIAEFEKGEILVTTMTSPSMMPLAKKAAAIVTNEGGICSHAAIISRELRIPCIVGTHDATRVLKTGDTVEVDALTGRVRKVK